MQDKMDLDVPVTSGLQHPLGSATLGAPYATTFQQRNNHPPIAQSSQHSDTAMSSEAGPSQLPIYPYKRTPGPPHLRMRLHPSQDLISRLNMMPAYDELVRPYTRVPDSSEVLASTTLDDKGKGKEIESGTTLSGVSLHAHATLAGHNAVAPPVTMTPEEKKQKTGKHDRGWRMFAQKVSGPFSTKKDTALQDIVKAPPRARLELNIFDRHALASFSLEQGQMEDQALRSLGVYLDGDKEKERRRDKERKKNKHKQAQAVAGPAGQQPPPGGSTPVTQPHTPATSQQASSSHPPLQQQQQQHPPINGVGNGISTPKNGLGQAAAGGPINGGIQFKAGKVRKERDDGSGTHLQPSSLSATPQGPPRPHKKRKVDGPIGLSASPHPHQHPHQPSPPMQQATPTF